jgi:hypothetical protein
MTTITISVSDLIRLVMVSSNQLDMDEQDHLIQTIGKKLNEWYDVPLIELSQIMGELAIPLENRCIHCDEIMPNFQGDVCSDCDTDIGSVG